MTLSAEQLKMLGAPLDPKLVKRKPTPGNPPYIPGWLAIETANRIFGPDGWGYSIDRIDREDAGGSVMYSAMVTVQVLGCPARQDIGTEIASVQRDGKPPSVLALETALKGSVTDGIKRALRSFGDQFGSQLYDKDSDLNAEFAAWLRSEAGDTTAKPVSTTTRNGNGRTTTVHEPTGPTEAIREPATLGLARHMLELLQADPAALASIDAAVKAKGKEFMGRELEHLSHQDEGWLKDGIARLEKARTDKALASV